MNGNKIEINLIKSYKNKRNANNNTNNKTILLENKTNKNWVSK